MSQDLSDETVDPQRYADVLSLLPPFPIVLVSTRTNVLTIGQIEYFTFSPLRIGIGVAHARHTYELLRSEGEFVVNVPGADIVDRLQLCGSASGRDGDKFAASGLTPVSSVAVAAVSIAECGAWIECKVEREIEFESRSWFVGEVVAARRRPDHAGADALLCCRTHYALAGEVVAQR